MIKWFLILLVACASPKKSGLKLPPGFDYSIRNIAQQSEPESRKTLTNKRNFLLALFEQSFDPYYGTPRWSEACLKENRIGEVQETSRGTYLVSKLYLANNFEPGFCPEIDQAVPYVVAIFHCRETQDLMEIRVPAKTFPTSFDWTSICE